MIALVTGADHPTGLGAARALRAAGAQVWGLAYRTDAWPCRSNVWSRLATVESADPTAYLDSMMAMARHLDAPAFLLPIQDDVVQAISTHREDLSVHYRFLLPDHTTVETFLDKTLFYDWALHRAFPHPKSYVAKSSDELSQILARIRFPAVIKPLYRTAGWQQSSPAQKAIRLHGPEDRDRIGFDLFKAAPAYLVSRWIAGADSDVHYCLTYFDADSNMVASYTGRKLLQYPRLTGSTAICVGTDNRYLRELTATVFREARFRGLGSLEVKRCATDGRYYITEPTVGRPNLQSYSAVPGGVNLAALAMYDALGHALPKPTRVRNCLWLEENALLQVATEVSSEPIPWRLLLREALRARRMAGAYFSWCDTGPFRAMVRRYLRRVVDHIVRRLLRRSDPRR